MKKCHGINSKIIIFKNAKQGPGDLINKPINVP